MGTSDTAEAPPPDQRAARVRTVVRVLGELMITAGIVLLLFVVYELYVTDWFSARKQDRANTRLEEQWNDSAPAPAEPRDGQEFARLHIPALDDQRFTVLEGTDQGTLAAGPGHYSTTAQPGERGNFAVAGHRIGKGAPFRHLDRMRSCDALIVETASEWYVYRVLPMREEVDGWDGRGGDPRCRGVAPIGRPYQDAVGRRIVAPDQGEVIMPVPGVVGDGTPEQQRTRLITLTTCHPWFSAEQRLIVHGVLTKRYPKDPDHPELRPAEVTEG